MKRLFYFASILIIGLTGCTPKMDFSKIVPKQVDNFATGFIAEVHKGNIDTCLTLMSPEMNNENGRQFLTNTHSNIQNFSLDSFSIISARKTTLFGDNGFTNYMINYEYKANNKFLYFTFGIKEQKSRLVITAFNGNLIDESLSKTHAFTLKNRGFFHYLFLLFAILIPIFIIVTLIFAIKTKLNKKWLWIVGILFGFIKFSINWTTGQIGFSLINISILGAGFSKVGTVAPWILSFSLPIVAVAFWNKRYWDIKESEAQTRLDERMKNQENLEKQE